MKKILGCLSVPLMWGWGFLGLFVHFLTTMTNYHEYGLLGGFIAFALVGFSEVFTLFHVAAVNPNGWNNSYTHYVGAWFGLWLIIMLISQFAFNDEAS